MKRKKYDGIKDGIKDGINDGKKSNNIERKILYYVTYDI